MAVDLSRTFTPINIALLTVSDTRTSENDTSGDILAERIKTAGHHLTTRAIERDDVSQIAARLARALDRWTVFAEPYQEQMHVALQAVADAKTLSADVREVIVKALGNAEA